MPRRNIFDVPACERCGKVPLIASMVSRFNTDVCCLDCIEDEKQAPNYRAAHDAELAAVKAGDYNYCHGLAAEDLTFLMRRRAERGRS